jgi:hypothetical protein
MPPIVHTVLLDLDPALPRETAEAVEALRVLVSLPGVRSMTVGPDVSPEGLGDGFNHAAVAVFDSPEARDAYLTAPDHLAAVAVLQRCLRRVTVVDVEAG